MSFKWLLLFTWDQSFRATYLLYAPFPSWQPSPAELKNKMLKSLYKCINKFTHIHVYIIPSGILAFKYQPLGQSGCKKQNFKVKMASKRLNLETF